MKKSLLAAAALSALALASPAYAQRDFRERSDVAEDRERPRGEDRERQRGRDGDNNQDLLGGAHREWSPSGREDRARRSDNEGGETSRWRQQQQQSQERQIPPPNQSGPGNWQSAPQGERRNGRGAWNNDDADAERHWRRGDDNNGRERREWNREQDWNRDADNSGDRGDWNRGQNNDHRDEDNRGRGEWNREHDEHRGEWNHDNRWRDRDNAHNRDDWNGRNHGDNRHRDWRRDDQGRDWQEWHWDRNDHRYARWRHTHRDFDRPRYRDWRHVRHGYYFDWGYAQIVSSFWGYNYYWWSYDGSRRPHRRWHVGDYLPHWVYWEPLPWDLYWRLPPPPYGCRYIVVDRDILLISLSTGIILDALLYY